MNVEITKFFINTLKNFTKYFTSFCNRKKTIKPINTYILKKLHFIMKFERN